MVKSRRTRKHAPQLIPSSQNNRVLPLDRETFGQDIEYAEHNEYANQLVITSAADRPTTDKDSQKKKHATSGSTPLSKRQRKQLERYLEKTKKRSNRSEVFDQLQALQKNLAHAPLKIKARGIPSSSSTTKGLRSKNAAGQVTEDATPAATGFLSISQAQTKGLKRHRQEQLKTAKKPKQHLSDAEDDADIAHGPSHFENATIDDNTKSLDDIEKSDAGPPAIVSSAKAAPASSTLHNTDAVLPDAETKPADRDTVKIRDAVADDDDRNPNAEFEFVQKLRDKSTVLDSAPTQVINPFRVQTFNPIKRTEAVQTSRMQLPIIEYEQQIMEMIAQNNIVVICGETGSGKTTQVPQFLYESGYASGAGIIGVTEPRRVAAISMSQRVADEMNLNNTRVVAYHIRYETNVVAAETKIKFMTDGVLLRELSQDFLLIKYSCIVLDEAHERSSFTDILIGLLSRIVRLREKRKTPLKLIIMSATLRVEDFTQNVRLFPTPPPVIHVQARQYDVHTHYNKRTPENYLLAAYKKVCKIHRQLPSGSILVFVTGQQEVHTLCRWLRQTFRDFLPTKSSASENKKAKPEGDEEHGSAALGAEEISATEADNVADEASAVAVNLNSYSVEPIEEDDERFVSLKRPISSFTPQSRADDGARRHTTTINDAALHAIDDAEEDEDANLATSADDEAQFQFSGAAELLSSSQPMRILPLYSLLSTERQQQVFQVSPPGLRTCIVATNVAETSLTLPGVRYVIDCGKVKAKLYDPITGASTFSIMWTSKASAEQRAGRAGRIAAGHCYRLYSSAVYNDQFEQYTPCEIVRRPIPDLVLQMKAMHIIKVDNFPFPTPPDADAVRAAERELIQLGALTLTEQQADGISGDNSSSSVADMVAVARVEAVAAIARAQNVSQSVLRRRVAKAKQQKHNSGSAVTSISQPIARITALGQDMAQIPLMPRYSKALVLAVRKAPDLLPFMVAVVSALTVPEVLLDGPQHNNDDVDADRLNSYSKTLQVLKTRWVSSSQQTLLFGDLGVLLKAVGGAEYAGCSQDWCETHGLRYKAMLEIQHLRHQLTSIVKRVFADVLQAHEKRRKLRVDKPDGDDLKLMPPTDAQLQVMRQIMLQSMPFQVARRADEADLASYVQQKATSGDDAAAVSLTKHDLNSAYKCIKTDEFVFLHPTSVLSNNVKMSSQLQLPQYILYQDLFESKGKRRRLYCRHVVAVDPDWLSSLAPEFCHFDEMVRKDAVTGAWVDLNVNADSLHEVFDTGAVFFDAAGTGKVMCRRRCTWGPLLWPMLNPAVVPLEENVERTKLFAAYFVQGDVFNAMKKYTPSLKWPANVLLKSWAKLLPHTQALIHALAQNGVDSKACLESVWKGTKPQVDASSGSSGIAARPLFLLEEYLMWLPEQLHGAVRKAWPPLK